MILTRNTILNSIQKYQHFQLLLCVSKWNFIVFKLVYQGQTNLQSPWLRKNNNRKHWQSRKQYLFVFMTTNLIVFTKCLRDDQYFWIIEKFNFKRLDALGVRCQSVYIMITFGLTILDVAHLKSIKLTDEKPFDFFLFQPISTVGRTPSNHFDALRETYLRVFLTFLSTPPSVSPAIFWTKINSDFSTLASFTNMKRNKKRKIDIFQKEEGNVASKNKSNEKEKIEARQKR